MFQLPALLIGEHIRKIGSPITDLALRNDMTERIQRFKCYLLRQKRRINEVRLSRFV